VASPAQRTQLQTEPELVARATALSNLAEVSVGQREILAQGVGVDLGWQSFIRIRDGLGLIPRPRLGTNEI
jgi:hypothetical protein